MTRLEPLWTAIGEAVAWLIYVPISGAAARLDAWLADSLNGPAVCPTCKETP